MTPLQDAVFAFNYIGSIVVNRYCYHPTDRNGKKRAVYNEHGIITMRLMFNDTILRHELACKALELTHTPHGVIELERAEHRLLLAGMCAIMEAGLSDNAYLWIDSPGGLATAMRHTDVTVIGAGMRSGPLKGGACVIYAAITKQNLVSFNTFVKSLQSVSRWRIVCEPGVMSDVLEVVGQFENNP